MEEFDQAIAETVNLPVKAAEYDFVKLQKQVVDAMLAAAQEHLDAAQKGYDAIKGIAEELMLNVNAVAKELEERKHRQTEFGRIVLDAAKRV